MAHPRTNLLSPILLFVATLVSAHLAVAADDPAPLVLDDPPAPLVPLRKRTEQDIDRLDALALFAAAANKQERNDPAGALLGFQRASRSDPTATAPLRAAVAVADRLRRYDVAARYARKLPVDDPVDPALLQRLGAYLLSQGDLEGVLRCYQCVLAQVGDLDAASLLPLRLEIGRLYFVNRQFPQAAAEFTQVTRVIAAGKVSDTKKLLGDVGKTYRLVGETFLLVDRLDDAAAAFTKANEAAPNAPLLEFDMARVALKKKQPAVALARLEKYLEAGRTEEQGDPYELLGEVLEALSRRDELVARLEKLRENQPGNHELLLALAGHYYKRDDIAKAEPLYAALIGDEPRVEAYERLVETYRQQKKYDRILDVVADFFRKGKTNDLDGLGKAGEALMKDDEAIRQVAAAAEKRVAAGSKEIALAGAVIAIGGKRFGEADRLFEAALSAPGTSKGDVYRAWAGPLLAAERNADAVRVLKKAVDEKPALSDRPLFMYLLSGALEAADQTEQALDVAGKALELRPSSPRFAARVAWIYYHARRTGEARARYAALVKKFDPLYGSEEIRDVLRESRLVLSNLAVERGDFSEAEEWLEQVLDEFPDDPGALNDLGYLWADRSKRLARALAMTQQAAKAEPDNLAYHDSVGWALYRVGRFEEAVAALEKAAAGPDPDAVVLDHLGDAYAKTGKSTLAVETWTRASKSLAKDKRPDPKRAAEIEKKLRDALSNP